MICIYHNRDLDGFTSGAIVKRKFPEVELVGYDYGQPIPWDAIKEKQDIVMIDVSVPMKDMEYIAKISKSFTWIDHHISAINDYHKYKDANNKGIDFLVPVLESGIAACEGAWKHYFAGYRIPVPVLLLGEYDTWRNQDKERWEKIILPFQFGMRLHCSSPETFDQYLLDGGSIQPVEDIISEGNTVLQYTAQYNEMQCKRCAFEMEWEGYKVICLNGGGFNSDVFKSVYDPTKHDIMMPFQFNGKFWVISLYTTHDNIDCSVIAKSKGGGGHKKAAGFQVDDIRQVIRL